MDAHPIRLGSKLIGTIGQMDTGLSAFLDDRRPQDLLALQPDLVIAAAEDEVDGVRPG